MSWRFPLRVQDLTNLEALTSPYGVFGFQRSYYTHKGVDLYTTGAAPVHAVEAGTVVAVVPFTGGPEEPQWLYTEAVIVEGPSGAVIYGEVLPLGSLMIGEEVAQGEHIANVTPVIPPDRARPDIPGHSCTMLHVELYTSTPSHAGDYRWKHGDPRPPNLKDPTPLLEKAWKAAVEA